MAKWLLLLLFLLFISIANAVAEICCMELSTLTSHDSTDCIALSTVPTTSARNLSQRRNW